MIDRYPMLGEKITALTKPYAFKGFTGMRNFVLEGENGERLAYANSRWININTNTGLPARLTEEDCRGYVLEEPLEMEQVSRKIQLPEEMTGAIHCAEAQPGYPSSCE